MSYILMVGGIGGKKKHLGLGACCVVVDVTEVLGCYSMACHGCENVTIERYKVFNPRVSRLVAQNVGG